MASQVDNTDSNEGEATAAKASDGASKVLELARKRRTLCVEAEQDDRLNAVDDLKFLAGGEGQWDARGLAARKRDGRPVITVNVLPTFLHQITNDQRQNTPSIKVHPVGDGADLDTAKVRQGMIRHIEYDSNADVAYDTAVNSAAAIGFGYFRIMPEHVGPESFDQKLCFKRIRNALSVRTDPLAVEADGSDMKFCFIETLTPKDEFRLEYPKANASAQGFFEADSDAYAGWYSDQTVTVCEYYSMEEEDDELVLLSDGTSGFKSKLQDLNGETVKKRRPAKRRKLIWRKITGADVLEETEIMCKWIPVFPVYGDELDIEGKVIRSGIVRNAKGPSQSYNVMISGATEEIAMRSKSPYIGAEGQFEGHEDEWNQANNRAFPYLEYVPKALDGKLAPPPQRQPMTDVPAGMLAMTMHAADNIKRTTGLFDASLGARGTATSGRQELAQQREGDVANFHYMDGLLRTVRHAGRCLNCMIRFYYDTERTVAIMREDNTTEYAKINQTLNQPRTDPKTGAIQKVLNDMTCGEFDITVSAGPSYSTMRQENAEFFTSALQAAKDPATASVYAYQAMRNNDTPGAQTATKMLEALLPAPAKAVLDQENGGDDEQPAIMTPQGPVPASQAGQLIAEMGQALQAAREELEKGEAAKAQAEGARAQEGAMKQQAALADKALEPERLATERKRLEADIAKANAAIATAEATKAQAIVDLERAKIEAAVLPQRLSIEAFQAQEKAIVTDATNKQSMADKDAERTEREQSTALQIAEALTKAKAELPKGMTITSPIGQTYEVKLH